MSPFFRKRAVQGQEVLSSGLSPLFVCCAGQQMTVTYRVWAQLIQASFEKYFWIPLDAAKIEQCGQHSLKLVNRRGIYKDSVGASQLWADYQLRPNFPIAMAVVGWRNCCRPCLAIEACSLAIEGCSLAIGGCILAIGGCSETIFFFS